ncbi:MAG: ABC transporter permease [Aigarchaeota archaeon]|nr:ABC transporter permease [Aigarchaeota archaeon]
MRSKVSVFFGILFPVMLLLVFGSIFGGPTPPNYTLYVKNLDVDHEGRPGVLSEAFIRALNESVFEVQLLKPGDPYPRSTGFAAIRVLTIPMGFTSNLINATIVNRVDITVETIMMMVEMAGDQIPPEARASISSSMEGINAFRGSMPAGVMTLTLEGSRDDRVLQPIEGIINTIASRFELALLNASSTIDVKTRFNDTRQLRSVDYYLPGYVAAFIMTNGLIGVSSLVSDMRRRGIIKLLASTPVSRTTWTMSIVIVQTVASLILLSVMIAVGWLVFRIAAIPDIYSIIVIILGTLAFTGFGMVIGVSLKEVEAVTALGNSLSFPMMFLSGALWPLELMPPYLQDVARLMPLYYFHSALRETLIVGSVMTATFPSLIVGVMATAGILLAISLTKWRDF